VAGAVAAADPAAAGAAAIFERTEAEWEGRVFGLFRSGDKAFFTFFYTPYDRKKSVCEASAQTQTSSSAEIFSVFTLLFRNMLDA
jgi:hypothetical protein